MVLLASDFDKSRYLKAADIERERKFRIKSVTAEEVGTGADKEKKLVVWFTNDECGLVLNKTNNRVLRSAFGDDVAGWAGKMIVVFSTMADNRGRMVPALRVRIPPPKQASGNGHAAAASVKAKPSADPELDDEPPAKPAVKQQVADDELDDEIGF